MRPGCSSTCDLRILADRIEVGRVRVRHHLALALLQLGPAHRGVGRDREHEVVDLRLAGPVLRERLVADDRVLLVPDEIVRPGADRLLVDLLRRAGLQHRVGVSFDCMPAYSIARSDRNGASAFLSVIRHRVVVDLLDPLQELRQPHVVEVRVVRARHLEYGLSSFHCRSNRNIMLSALKSRVGFQRAVVVPLDAFAQLERVDLAVG